MVSSVKQEAVTQAERRAAVQRVASSQSKTVRISEGQRKAIVSSEEYRNGHRPAPR